MNTYVFGEHGDPVGQLALAVPQHVAAVLRPGETLPVVLFVEGQPALHLDMRKVVIHLRKQGQLEPALGVFPSQMQAGLITNYCKRGEAPFAPLAIDTGTGEG